ncbi:MAG: hypothetical protein NVS1B4_04130 [Gemmatimonadaceae bacterium]
MPFLDTPDSLSHSDWDGVSRRLPHAVLFATILAVTVGCDKAKELAGAARSATASGSPAQTEPAIEDRLDLSKRPDVLFQVFGERDDPRMLPVGVIVGGRLRPIVLTASGWKQFDAMYGRSGTTYALYRGGVRTGAVRVKQGMWEKEGTPLYSLPNCSVLTPLSAVTIEGNAGSGFTVEAFASSATLAARSKPSAPASPRETSIARDIASRLALAAGIPQATLDSLDFRAAALSTGAGTAPTLLASYIDQHAEEKVAANGATAHVLVIADRDASGEYQATFSHVVNGPASGAEFRRLVDRLDIAGDGVDQIVLEAWQYGGDTFLIALAFVGGKWGEVFRGRASWCLDARSAP